MGAGCEGTFQRKRGVVDCVLTSRSAGWQLKFVGETSGAIPCLWRQKVREASTSPLRVCSWQHPTPRCTEVYDKWNLLSRFSNGA